MGKLRQSRLGQTTENWIRKYYWSDYSKYAAHTASLPREAVSILRPVFLLAVSLCLLLPVAMEFPWLTTAAPIEGAKGPVASWSIVLWLISLSLAWSSLLVGALICNRLALLVSVVLYLFFFGIAAMGPPRSAWNVLVPVVALTAVGLGEFHLDSRSYRGLVAGVFLCVPGGMGSGVALIALTPLARVFSGHILSSGICFGTSLGLLALLAGRFLKRRVNNKLRFPAATCLAVFAFLMFAYQITLLFRGGMAVPANATLNFLTMWTGYLWPLYYFIGVGAIFKVQGWSKDVTFAVQQLIPPKFFTAVLMLIAFGAAAIGWGPLILDTPALPWPSWMLSAAAHLYRFTSARIWSDPINATTWEWLRWVLLFDVVAFLWLLIRRRLDSQAVSALLFMTVLMATLTYEYMFQFSGFSRTGVHSALVLFTFSIGILWMVHTTAMKFMAKSTPRWPQLGRFGIYGALLIFVLLSLHARAAIHDTRIMDEVFLYFFDGLIGIGFPYYLYVYATRSLQSLPLSVSRLFGAFCFGGAFSFLVIALDKLVAAGGSLQMLTHTLQQQREMILVSGILPTGRPNLPAAWIVVRGALVLSSLAGFALLARRRMRDQPHQRASVIFILIAASLGFASLSRLRVSLPLLPLSASLLITPFQPSITLDLDLVATYLIYAIPAMILSLALTGGRSGFFSRRTAGVAAAFSLQSIMALSWPGQEAAIRSAGALSTAGSAGLFLFFALILAIRGRVESIMGLAGQNEQPGPGSPGWYIGGRTLKALLISMSALLVVGAVFQLYRGRVIPRPVPGFAQPLSLPVAWTPVSNTAPGGPVRFTRPSMFPRPPALMVEMKPNESQEVNPRPLLEGFARSAAANLPGFSARQPENWDSHFAGSFVMDFTFDGQLPNGNSFPLAASMLVLPLPDRNFLVVTLIAVFDDWQQQRWDLARLAEGLRR